jgi:hypothetical protein
LLALTTRDQNLSMMKTTPFVNRISVSIITILWILMLITMLTQRKGGSTQSEIQVKSQHLYQQLKHDVSSSLRKVVHDFSSQHAMRNEIHRPVRMRATLTLPNRYVTPPLDSLSPSLEEIKHNMTTYLHQLHSRLEALAGKSLWYTNIV